MIPPVADLVVYETNLSARGETEFHGQAHRAPLPASPASVSSHIAAWHCGEKEIEVERKVVSAAGARGAAGRLTGMNSTTGVPFPFRRASEASIAVAIHRMAIRQATKNDFKRWRLVQLRALDVDVLGLTADETPCLRHGASWRI